MNDKTENLEESIRKELNANQEGGSELPKDQPQEKKEDLQGSGNATLPRYKVGNRELDSDQLYEEYRKAQAALTKAFQEKSELEKQLNSKPQQGKEEEKVVENKINPNDAAVLAELRRLGVVTKEDLDKVFENKESELVKRAVVTTTARQRLEEALDELEEDFNGQEEEINGIKVRRPKVERQKIWEYIMQNPNTNLSPLEIARNLYYDDFVKYEGVKYIPRPAGNLPKTEDVGLGGSPEPPTPRYSFKDGSVEKAIKEVLSSK